MRILGISAFFHDSAAALVVDGEIIAAAQEERFSRRKHDDRFPKHAAAYCLSEAGLQASELDAVVFYEKPLMKFERMLETALAFAPRGFGSFVRSMPQWLQKKLHLPREIDAGLGGMYSGPILFTTHHEAHAASAFYPSPFHQAAILTMDGVGEWTTASWGVGRGNTIQLQHELRFPHSLGLLYSAFTYYCGFRVNSGEYKLMGLAPFGTPRFAQVILEKIVRMHDDGSIWLDQSYFNYAAGLTMTSAKFHTLFGAPPRDFESRLTQRDMDMAASIQLVTEEIVLRMARHVHTKTGMKNLCLAGGVALNCVANGRLLREGPFERLWIQPAAGDSGGALGAALLHWHGAKPGHLGHPRRVNPADSQRGSYLGPAHTDADICSSLDQLHAVYETLDEAALTEAVAAQLASGKIVGHFYGRAEFGPRALGHRSILGDARDATMQRRMNVAIKFRESFRPFAPAVLAEKQSEWFELDTPSPYMLLVAPVAKRHLHNHAQESSPYNSPTASANKVAQAPDTNSGHAVTSIDALKHIRSDVPAITHVDNSARVQTVDAATSPRLHAILQAFERRTGCPVVINTSFNIRGEPIVHDPGDAYRCFMFTDMDALVVGNQLLRKEDQPPMQGADAYKQSFRLD